jgi:hypothetical protein
MNTSQNNDEDHSDDDKNNNLTDIRSRFLMDERQKVDDVKMIFTLCCAATYCLTVTIVTGYYAFNQTAYNGGITSLCYASTGSSEPVRVNSGDARDITADFESLMIVGFAVHFIGFFCDSSFAIRVKVENKAYRVASLIAVGIYSTFFGAWLIWLIVLRYRFVGKVCSGEYLAADEQGIPRANYTIQQG